MSSFRQSSPIIAAFSAAAVAWAAFSYRTWPGPTLTRIGLIPWRYPESYNNGMCRRVPELQACEKMVWDDPSSTMYLACSSNFSRQGWTPSMDALDASARSAHDYVATYMPDTGTVTKLQIVNYPHPGQGISMHGMSVVPASDPDHLWIYLVNHRVPRSGGAGNVGADSTIEALYTRRGDTTLDWKWTFTDNGKVLRTPNDVIGSPNGDWVYFTNEYDQKIGISRFASRMGLPFGAGSIGFCDVQNGCKTAASGLPGANGIARDHEGLIWVAAGFAGRLTVFEETAPGTLKEVDRINVGLYMDNISVDSSGALFVVAFPRPIDFKFYHASGGRGLSSSSVYRVTVSPDYVSKGTQSNESMYILEKIFEDDGREANGISTAEHVGSRRELYLHGLMASYLSICTI